MHLHFLVAGVRWCVMGSRSCLHTGDRVKARFCSRVGNQENSWSWSHSSYIPSSGKRSKRFWVAKPKVLAGLAVCWLFVGLASLAKAASLPIGFGPWPRRVKPRLTVDEVYRWPLLFNCLLLPWKQICPKCPPLPQPQHTGACLPTTTVGDLVSRLVVDCWRRCLISANSSQTKLVVKLVGSSAAAVATCTTDLPADDNCRRPCESLSCRLLAQMPDLG